MDAQIVSFPSARGFPPPTGDEYLDGIELAILRAVVAFVQHGYPLKYALGLSASRRMYLDRHPELEGGDLDHEQYLSLLVVALKKLSPRQQSKVRHPARSRAEAQTLLEGKRL